MLLDNGYSNVFEMTGGFDAWTKAGYPVVSNIAYPAGLFTTVTGPLTLTSDETGDTPIPYGSVITHWRNGITEVTSAVNQRILLAKDSEAATVTTVTGEVKPVTWIYKLPQGTTVVTNSEPGVTKMMLDGNVILTIISKGENFTP
jgi:hypothetical protein